MAFRSVLPHALLLLAVACGGRSSTGDETSDGGSSDGSGDDGDGTGDSGGDSVDDDGGSDASGDGGSADDGTTAGDDADTGGGAVECGAGVTCDAEEFCDWSANFCGTEDWDEGMCVRRPDACDDEYDPVCGCDGEMHSNACQAQAAGADAYNLGGCEPPDGLFPCGFKFCELSSQYCQHGVSDVLPLPDSWSCLPIPNGCGNGPSCDCLAAEPCADFGGCEGTADTGLVIVCPGG